MSFFVTFEGPEGSGKTTQMHLLAAHLRAGGHDVLATREPGGTAIGDLVRAILLDPARVEMAHQTEFLLFSAARAQHVQERIGPHLGRGGVVLCDRFADSSLAYQGYGRGLDLDALRAVTAFATAGLRPDLSFYLDLPVEVGLQRKAGGEGDSWNRIEQLAVEYHHRVRAGYLEMITREPERWVIVDATRAAGDVQAVIRRAFETRHNRGEG